MPYVQARFSAGAIATGVGSATLPTQTLIGGTTNRICLEEISVVNTTVTACTYKLVRLTTTTVGTPGTSLTSSPHDLADTGAIQGVVKQVYTVAPSLGNDMGYTFVLPAAIGAGVIRTFQSIIIPTVANAGLALMPIGTGQLCAIDWTWTEL